MKIAGHTNTLETNAQVKRKNFGIGDVSAIIKILRSKMYTYPIRTLVQEYICNGRDAMREAGSKRAIEVTVPNRMSPVFKVRDFGVGLSPDRIENVFVMYGSSTKRSSNKQTGGFGIGAKSAWAYTDSFTVTSWYNGKKRQYVCHIGANEEGSMDLVSETDTTEPNGVEVQVAVKPNDLQSFREAVFRCLYFWPNDSYKLKGVIDGEDESQSKAGFKLGKNLEVVNKGTIPRYICDDSGWEDKAFAVIDGIVYPIDTKLYSGDMKRLLRKCVGQVLLHFKTGQLEVGANRETLSDTDITKQNLDIVATEALKEVTQFLQKEFAKVKSVSEYVETHNRLNKSFQVSGQSSYKGYSLTSGDKLSSDKLVQPGIQAKEVYYDGRTGKLKKVDLFDDKLTRYYKPGLPIHCKARWYYDDKTESGVMNNRRIRKLLETEKNLVVISGPKGKSLQTIIDDLKLKDITKLPFDKVEKSVPVKVKRGKKEFCMHDYTGYGRFHRYTTLEKNHDKWVWLPEIDHGKMSQIKQLIKYYRDADGVCVLGKTAQKIVANDKNFINGDKYLEKVKPKSGQIADYKSRNRLNSDAIDLFKRMKTLNDPKILEMIEEYDKIKKARSGKMLPHTLYKLCDDLSECKDFIKRDKEFESYVKKNYPLLSSFSSYADKAIVNELEIYINAKGA